MTDLPDADEVFDTYFLRWYSAEDLARRQYSATRPDVEGWGAPGSSAHDLSPLDAEGRQLAADQIQAIRSAAATDWPALLQVSGTVSLGWIDEFDRYYDRERVQRTIAASDPTDFGSDLVVICCEFGAMLGHVLKQSTPQLDWLYDWPYWESALYDSKHGMRINVFHWAIKKFSDYGVDDGFRAKLLQCQALVRQGWV